MDEADRRRGGGPSPAAKRAVAVVCNPGGGRVRGRLDTIRRLGRRLAGEAYREAEDGPEIAEATREALADGARVLALVGGDGTIQAALTALERSRPAGPWPLLAPVAGGTANVTARDVGAGSRPADRLEALLRWRDGESEGRLVRRSVLRIERPERDPLAGMFFGTGLAAAGVENFQERLGDLRIAGQGPAALALGRVLWELAFGGADETVRPRRLEVSVDDDPPGAHTCLLCVAGTLERFLLNTRPYWGEGPGPIRFTLVERGARRLWWRLPRLATGRPGDALRPEEGYRSRNATRVNLRFDGPFVVDGELHRARAADGPLRIGVAAEPRWLTF